MCFVFLCGDCFLWLWLFVVVFGSLCVCVCVCFCGSYGGSFLCLLLLVVGLVVYQWWVCSDVSGSDGDWVFKNIYLWW